jgi:hypothetical protein
MVFPLSPPGPNVPDHKRGSRSAAGATATPRAFVRLERLLSERPEWRRWLFWKLPTDCPVTPNAHPLTSSNYKQKTGAVL